MTTTTMIVTDLDMFRGNSYVDAIQPVMSQKHAGNVAPWQSSLPKSLRGASITKAVELWTLMTSYCGQAPTFGGAECRQEPVLLLL